MSAYQKFNVRKSTVHYLERRLDVLRLELRDCYRNIEYVSKASDMWGTEMYTAKKEYLLAELEAINSLLYYYNYVKK